MSYDVAVIGAGFIGSTVARNLSRNYEVITFDKNRAPRLLRDVNNVEHRVCDISNYADMKERIGTPRVVIHTAIIQIPAINQMKREAYDANVLGTHNVCKLVKETDGVLGLVLCGSWHVFGEREYKATIDVSFGYRPDKVEERATLYVISKMIQEGIVRFYNSMVESKTYSIIRLGTVLGENMPEKTAANIFISNGLQGKPLTPFKHTMHRPMLYVDVDDVCNVFRMLVEKLGKGNMQAEREETSIYNLFYPKPITILELARVIREAIAEHTRGEILPEIEIVDKNLPVLFSPDEKDTLKVDIEKTKRFFGIKRLKSPKDTINEIVSEEVTKRRAAL
jgi:nucleoside-diphosphate-sugar epimerase